LGPFGSLAVRFQLDKTLAGLYKNSPSLNLVLFGSGLVKGFITGLTVNGVRRVGSFALVGTVGTSLRVRGTVTNDTEDRESGGFSGSGVGSGRNKGGSGSGNSC